MNSNNIKVQHAQSSNTRTPIGQIRFGASCSYASKLKRPKITPIVKATYSFPPVFFCPLTTCILCPRIFCKQVYLHTYAPFRKYTKWMHHLLCISSLLFLSGTGGIVEAFAKTFSFLVISIFSEIQFQTKTTSHV